jgi:hypothetical protein
MEGNMGKGRKKGYRKQLRMRHWTSPNKSVIREYAERAMSIGVEHYIPNQVPPTDVLVLADRYDGVKPPLMMPTRGHQIPEERDNCPPAVRVLLKLLHGDSHNGIAAYHWQRYPHPKYQWVYLFFSGNKYLWGAIVPGALRITVEYEGRERAWRAYERDRIEFITRIPIPPSLSSPT